MAFFSAGLLPHNRLVKTILPIVVMGALALNGVCAWANTSEFIVSGWGEAAITTGSGTVNITLTDLYVNPDSVSENMSGFIFTLSTTPGSASIATSSGTEITVDKTGAYTIGSSVATGWGIALDGATTTLDDLGDGATDTPRHTILGPPGSGGYDTGGDGSIAGNKAHNAFLDQTATFTLDEAGVTASATVTSTIFQFGTTDGQGRSAGALVATPEPSTLALFSCAALLMVLARRRRASGH